MGFWIERHERGEVFPRQIAAHDEPVRPEALTVEKRSSAQSQRRIELVVEGAVEALELDAELFEEFFRLVAETGRRIDGLAAAIADEKTPIAARELVALGVPAEVVVIIENENTRLCAHAFSEEVRGGEPADAAPDDDQVIGFARVRGVFPRSAVFHLMRRLPRPVVRASHPGKCGRIR